MGLQKETIPELINKTAIATKKGPAAPVTLSAHRSRALKHRNTVREQIIWQRALAYLIRLPLPHTYVQGLPTIFLIPFVFLPHGFIELTLVLVLVEYVRHRRPILWVSYGKTFNFPSDALQSLDQVCLMEPQAATTCTLVDEPVPEK